MDLKQSVKAASLNKSTYINLRWIGILGQFITINTVKFIFGFEFNFILSNLIIFVGAPTKIIRLDKIKLNSKPKINLTVFIVIN